MSYNLEFTIYNYPLTNVSATDGITTITLGNGINVDMTGNSYRGILVSENDSASITVSANGFFPKTKTISDDVVDSFTLTRINNLYAYTDPNVSGETLYAWTVDPEDIKNLVIEFPFRYIKDGQYLTLPDNTIYTKTPVVNTSTNVYYLVDNTELAITNIHFSSTDLFDSNGIISADANSITIEFSR